MSVQTLKTPAAEVDADVVVVGIYEAEPLAGSAAQIDGAAGGALARLIEGGEIKAEKLSLGQLLAPSGVKAMQVLTVGLGKRGELDAQTAFRSAGAAAKKLAGKKRKSVAYYLGEDWPAECNEAGLCGAAAGSLGQDLYRKDKRLQPPDNVLWAGVDDSAIAYAAAVADGVNLARKLVNEPADAIYPETFAKVAAEVAAECGLQATIWDEQRLTQERCGSLLGVARGSARPPRLVMLRHAGGGAGKPTLALVGKGVTFDSGGYSLKPGDGMVDMKCDMAGAATVLGAMQAIARLKLPINVIGLMGLVENLVSGNSYKLGDVLTARNGKTIEVLNTDAEGRLVLADVLDVAVGEGADKIIDLATLTGACMVALGTDVAGLMTNDQPWCDAVQGAADAVGEYAWQLPMHSFFGDQIKSEVADIKNIGEGRWGGTITAAKFLEEFVAGKPWVHIDIAGPAFLNKPKTWLDAGGSGCFVRTLVEVARRWKS
ncbi:MAG: leucyl aminopeptidase [Planctomycetales bacterium]|nr:leucyl aminopeptidase [Planctomycetales bacterium]